MIIGKHYIDIKFDILNIELILFENCGLVHDQRNKEQK